MPDKVSAIVPALFVDATFVDMTATCMRGLFSLHELVVIGSKRGYAENVNTGLRIATGDILLICNNDIEFIQYGWLDHLLQPLHDGYDISSIRTTDSDGWTTENRIEEGAKFGSIWAMKREVYETIGPLDESFGKGYFEDLDYQKRAEDAGFKVAKNHAGLVEHKGKATFALVDPEDTAYQLAMERFRAKWGAVW